LFYFCKDKCLLNFGKTYNICRSLLSGNVEFSLSSGIFINRMVRILWGLITPSERTNFINDYIIDSQ